MVEEKNIRTLPGPIDLAKETWEIYKKRFWTVVGITVLGIVAGIVGFIVAGGIGTLSYFGLGAKFQPSFILVVSICFISFVVLISLLSAWATAAIILSLNKWKSEEKMRGYLSEAKPFILPFFFTSLLSGVLGSGAAFFFIIPAFVFALWFSMWKFVLVLEGRSGLSALHTSREYVRGRFWQVLGRIIAVHLPILIIGIFFTHDARGDMQAGPLQGVYQLVSLILTPFYLMYSYVLYTHLKKTTPAIPKDVPSKSKLVYILVPVIGVLMMIGVGIFAVPFAIKMSSQFTGGIPGNESSIVTGNSIKPSTAIVYGLTTYYQLHSTFPSSLEDLKTAKILNSIPEAPGVGKQYRYSVEKNGQDFKLCTPMGVKPENCITTTSKNFDL